MSSPLDKFPPLENYPPLVEAVMRQIVPGLDVPLDWLVCVGTGIMFDGIIYLFVYRPQFYVCGLLWALPWYLVAMRLDRRDRKLPALSAFFLGWGGSVTFLMLAYSYFLQATTLITVVLPILAALASFLALCAASRLIDAKAPVWMGWFPRLALILAHRIGMLPKFLKPAAFSTAPRP